MIMDGLTIMEIEVTDWSWMNQYSQNFQKFKNWLEAEDMKIKTGTTSKFYE
jgi:hypothetical protein